MGLSVDMLRYGERWIDLGLIGEIMSRYADFETLLETEGLEFEAECRLFAHAVGGPGLGIRERLEAEGFSDFRFDYVLHEHKIAIEVQGSGHSHGHRKNQQRDWKKCNDAARLGWTTIYFPAARVSKHPHVVVDEISEILEGRAKNA